MRLDQQRGARRAYYACSLAKGQVYLLGVGFRPGARGTRHGDRASVEVLGSAGPFLVFSQLATEHAHGRYRHSLHLADLARGRDTMLLGFHAPFQVTFRTGDRAMTPTGAVAFNASDEEKARFFNVLLYDGATLRILAGNVGPGVTDVRLHPSAGRSAYTVSWVQGKVRHQVVTGA